MPTLNTDSIADIEFGLIYESAVATHTERFFAHNVNIWRDLFHPELYRRLIGASENDTFSVDFKPGEIVARYDSNQRFRVYQRQFDRKKLNGNGPDPLPGRFYPRGVLKGIAGVFPQNVEPFRVIDVDRTAIVVEFNHPLAQMDLKWSAGIKDIRPKHGERGGTSIDWSETLTAGPGMQVRENGTPTPFIGANALDRQDTHPDTVFYRKPRFVNHLDDMAIHLISELYGSLIQPGMAVLDLMSSWVSHIPKTLNLKSVDGLGLNELELSANEQLTRHMVHDLNSRPVLPYSNNQFDAVLCTASVEYLTQPFEIFNEVARVLKPEGVFILTFSNRWFPPKVVNVWTGLHEFERMGLVLEYFSDGNMFTNLETLSVRGFPRPVHDKYFSETRLADPVYAVWGYKA